MVSDYDFLTASAIHLRPFLFLELLGEPKMGRERVKPVRVVDNLTPCSSPAVQRQLGQTQ